MGSNHYPGFTVRTDVRYGVARLAFVGELDLAAAPTLEDELLRVESDGIDAAVLDLGELTFMDCSGLHVLLGAADRVKENGHRMALVGVGGLPRRVMELTATEKALIDESSAAPMMERFSRGDGEPAATIATLIGAEDD